ncbi:hypothetical protein GCK32_003606 [Trichostrongylus colubriformis]|uniref:Uncharacterized protein n=1 Tax=Trichostrongylus colubriformis TaxID=6319 RepID=A0AAN8FT64_TRICO
MDVHLGEMDWSSRGNLNFLLQSSATAIPYLQLASLRDHRCVTERCGQNGNGLSCGLLFESSVELHLFGTDTHLWLHDVHREYRLSCHGFVSKADWRDDVLSSYTKHFRLPENLSLVLTTPDGDLASYDNVYDDGTNYIWTKNGPHIGNWLISIWTSDQTLGCNYKVLQKSYHNQVSLSDQFDLFWAISPRIDSDETLLQPQYRMDRSIVMHLTNYALNAKPERVQTFLSIRAIRNNRPVTVYNSNGIWRDGCSYQFYFPSMTCQIPNEILYFNFFVLDSLGFTVQRAGVMYCVYEQPTPQPPPHQCQNGGIINPANTTCFCPPGFTGTYCQQIMCYNGGTPAGESCQCPTGWTGMFCELAKCVSKGVSPEYLRTNLDMVFVLELTQQAHAQALRLIPLQYSSGIVFSQYKSDCVDPMQVNKTGLSGNEQPSMSVLSDPITGWDILEIRKKCDPGWDEVQQYCIRFVLPQYTQSDAQQFCHDAGGSLVDDLSEVKHSYLQGEAAGFNFWLGLSNPNNTGYVWDSPDGTPPLPKHRYDPDHRPNVIGDLDLPAGKWYVTVQVASNTQRSCFVQARVQSDLQIVPGFVTTVTGDQPDNDPVQDSPNNRLITYIHSLDNAHRSPILTHALLNDAANGTFYNAVTYSQRAQCSYPWQTQSFSCPNSAAYDNEFTITHMGEDEYGNLFQRVTYGHCDRETITCNGGVRWQGLCICTEYWTGKQCNIPICVNGGALSPDYRRCDCSEGYAGEHCEFELCTTKTPITFSPDAKTFVLIVETTFRNQPMINALVANLSAIVNGATQDTQWFSNYALVTYDCKALRTALSSRYVQAPNSEVFAVTSAGISDQKVRDGDVELISNAQAHFTYVYNSASDCGTIPYDDSFPQTTRLAYSSSGNVLLVAVSDFSQMFSVYLPTLYGSYALTNPTGHQGFTCSTPNDWYVEVDFATTRIYVTTSVNYGTLGVVNPLKEDIVPTILYKTKDTQFYEIDVDRLPGIYTLSLTSPGECFVHVFATGGAKVYYEFAETSSVDPTASHIDGYNGSPEVGVSNVLTLHVDAAPGTALKQIELFDPDTLQVVLRSPLYQRMNCSFEYYSDPFTCTSEAIAMFVYGEDDRRQPFRRQELTYCSSAINSTPTATSLLPTNSWSSQPPTATSLLPTGSPTTTPAPPPISFDVVILIDVRQSASTRYDDMSQFVSTLLSAYEVSQSYTRVGVVPVFGNAALGPMVTASLNAIDSMVVLKSYLAQNKEYNDFASQGQALAQALYTAINPNFKRAGYRSDITNHLILYITASSGFTDQPQMVAQQVLQSGDYGIVTVGYGPLVTDLPGMQTIAGGEACSFYGADLPSLLAQLDPVRMLISTADTNGGKYCGN